MDKKFKGKKHRNIKTYDIRLSDNQEQLSGFLWQYSDCIRRKKTLERRRREIMKEFDMPLSGVSMDGMPKGGTPSSGCAAISIRLDDIEQKIREQAEQATKILSDILDVIELLPDNTPERGIIESRYIDRMGWSQVCQENNFSRTHAIRYWKKGLDDLLSKKRARDIMKKYGFEYREEKKEDKKKPPKLKEAAT